MTTPASIAAMTAAPGSGVATVFIVWHCYSTRKSQIGGWLRLFYYQLYIGVGASFFLVNPDDYNPHRWPNIERYALFCVATIPTLAVRVAQCAIGTILIWRRSWTWIQYLKIAFVADVVALLAGMAIIGGAFDQTVILEAVALIWPAIWLPYFIFSKRVRAVFLDKNWPEPRKVDQIDLSSVEAGREMLRRAGKLESAGHASEALILYAEIAKRFASDEVGRDAQISFDQLEKRQRPTSTGV